MRFDLCCLCLQVPHIACSSSSVTKPRYVIHMSSATAQATAAAGQRWALAVHGGAGVINSTHTEWLDDAKRGLTASLRAGQLILEAGGLAIDAVVAAVEALENDSHFNAGTATCAAGSGP